MTSRLWRRFLGRTVRVHLPEKSIEGVLTHVSRQNLVLRGASLPQEMGQAEVTIDGEVIVERSRIVFGQGS